MTEELDEETRAARERRVAEEAQRFNLGALMRVLSGLGYDAAQILFESNPEPGGSEGVVERLRFLDRPQRSVRITLNLGLLGRETLLPSYFFRALAALDDPKPFLDFVRYFDDRLLANYVRASYPEQDAAVYRDWEATKGDFFHMLGVSSVATIQQTARLIFPELAARVRRASFSTSTGAHAFRIGISQMDGSTVIGRQFEWFPAGFQLDLVTEDERAPSGRSWAQIVEERLHAQLLPLLAPHRVPLSVKLTVLDHGTWVEIEDLEDDRVGQLGYERLRDDHLAPLTILLYRGIVGAEGDASSLAPTISPSRRSG